jgi:hypothetical protein
VKKDLRYTITTLWTKFFYEYLLKDEQELSVGETLMVYFGTPSMFITVDSSGQHTRALDRAEN